LTGFSDEQIISLLNGHNGWTKRACREILRQKDRFIPRLLEILDRQIEVTDTDWDDTEEAYFPAALLLAQMREPAAYPRLVRLISGAEFAVARLWGDLLLEYYGAMLRDTYNGDPSLLSRLIEDPSVSEWSRGMALSAWGMLYFDGHISREAAVNFLRRLIHEVYAGKPSAADIIVLTHVAACVKEQRFTELLEDIKTLYDRHCIEVFFFGNYEEYVDRFHAPENVVKDEHAGDAVAELEKWSWFKEDSGEDEGSPLPPLSKIGRNEPCPCGSGKKYKNCCLK
jgi:hypothetical protein